jgi:hypothetical protein
MERDSGRQDQAGVLAGIVPGVDLAAEPGRMDFWREEQAPA